MNGNEITPTGNSVNGELEVQVLSRAPVFIEKIGDSQNVCTEFAQNIARTADRRVKFPVTIRHRTSKAKIYAPGGKFTYYRLAYSTAGKRRMQTFANYSAAKTAAERIVRELADGSQAATPSFTKMKLTKRDLAATDFCHVGNRRFKFEPVWMECVSDVSEVTFAV
jgi:hypothetical protein